jgi:hypothetical protein
MLEVIQPTDMLDLLKLNPAHCVKDLLRMEHRTSNVIIMRSVRFKGDVLTLEVSKRGGVLLSDDYPWT